MTELTWRYDKKIRRVPDDQVPVGPWTDEPDKIQWIDAETGLDCLIVRNPLGALCGYVGVPPGHPLYEVDCEPAYEQAYERGVDLHVHGGLTFADRCAPGEPVEGICHVAASGATAEPWWLGFDTAHCGDLTPLSSILDEIVVPMMGIQCGPSRNDTYKDVAYVKHECATLAKQLADVH